MRQFDNIVVAGNTYGVCVEGPRIVGTSCEGRWPMCGLPTGSAWLDSQLMQAVQQRILDEIEHQGYSDMRGTNPYPIDTDEHDAWRIGNRDARKEYSE